MSSVIEDQKLQARRYSKVRARAAAQVPDQIDVHTLLPGQTQELKINQLDQSLSLAADISHQIHMLEKRKKQAKASKNSQAVIKISQLHADLTSLEHALDAQISHLKAQQQVIPSELIPWLVKIDTDCTQYLHQVKQANKWLYRGSEGDDAFVSKSWLTRQPTNSNPEAQHLFDQMLAQLGFVALRGNSIFATSNFAETKQYGSKTFVIFPVDGASHFTYTNTEDLILDDITDVGFTEETSNQLKQELLPYLLLTQKQLGDKASPVLNALITQTNNTWQSWMGVQNYLDMFLKTGIPHEIPEKFLDPDLVKHATTVHAFVEKWEPKHTNLAHALLTFKEVYVSGAYYALDAQKFGPYITQYFHVPIDMKNPKPHADYF